VTSLESLLESDILTLGMAADDARRAASSSGIVTYLRVHNVTAAELERDLVVPEAASEIRLYELPDTVDAAMACVARIKQLAGGRRVVAYSMAELEARARGGWGLLSDVLTRLVAAGLSDVAEMPADQLEDLADSMRALRNAGAEPRRITVSAATGDRKLEILDRVCLCRASIDSALYVAPLPRRAPSDKPTTGYEDLRMVALARLALHDSHPSRPTFIEVDWALYGPKLAQVALLFGADHLDAVSATSEASLGPRRATVADVERNIRAAGFQPQEYRPTT